MNTVQKQRLIWRSGFFALFLVAPILDILRLDLHAGNFVIFGFNASLGLQGADIWQASTNILLRVFLPALTIVGVGFWISWKYGRLYCGWLCPHFSVVEMINGLMRRAIGKPTLWLNKSLPEVQDDGTEIHPRRIYVVFTSFAVLFFAFLWAITLLTYLLPPREIWSNLFTAELTRNQFTFIAVGTFLLCVEFAFARHLFCRFGCAVGLFQSLIWMGNKKAMVVAVDRKNVDACIDCDQSCEHACPMRLKPRQIKRRMFTCTQCQQCVQACDSVNDPRGRTSPLRMISGVEALQESDREARSTRTGYRTLNRCPDGRMGR